MMPDYMEAAISAYGLPKVLEDLRINVVEMAENTGSRLYGDRKLWLLEHDLTVAIQEFVEDDT